MKVLFHTKLCATTYTSLKHLIRGFSVTTRAGNLAAACQLTTMLRPLRGRSQLSTFMYSYRAYGGGGGRGHEASVLIFKC